MRLTDTEKRILTVFGKSIPKLSNVDKERLLAFGEGILFKTQEVERQKQKGA